MGTLIDWHIHCFKPEHMSDEDRGRWATTNVAGEHKADPTLFRHVIDEAGLDQFVLVSIPVHGGLRTPHDFIAEMVAEYPGRAVGFAAVHPKHASAADEFEEAVTRHGMQGLKISPTYQAVDPRSPECWQLYEIAMAHGVPVMMHCGGAYTGSLEFADPCLVDKVAMAFPDLKIIIAHFGQPYMEQTAILMRKNANVFADISARQHRPWQLYNGIMVAHEYKVTDRLLFGSDFPVLTPAEAIKRFRAINDWGVGINVPRIPDELIEDILYERPLSLLDLTPA